MRLVSCLVVTAVSAAAVPAHAASDCLDIAWTAWPGAEIDQVEVVPADTVRPFGASNLPAGAPAPEGTETAFLPAH